MVAVFSLGDRLKINDYDLRIGVIDYLDVCKLVRVCDAFKIC